MLLYRHHNRWEAVLIEIDDALEVELWAKQVEEHVLAVTLVHLTALIRQFVEHWERLGCV